MICELHYDCAECCESEQEAVHLARAESEAKIAALQSERDALKKALQLIHDKEIEGYVSYCGMPWRERVDAALALSTPASGEPARRPIKIAEKLCPDCNHSLEDNNHGFDQNDGFLNENGELIHSGRCTYCKICNPSIFQPARKP